jgi:hypothetical protein
MQLEELRMLEHENRTLRQQAEVLENMLIDIDKQASGGLGKL